MADGEGGAVDVAALEAAYRDANAAWEAAHDARFPDGNRDELKRANDEAFAAWDHAAWVATQEEGGHTVAEDGVTVIEGPEPTVHDDGVVG